MKPTLFYIPHHNIGAHFLIWSMYYLSKQDRYLSNNGILEDLPMGAGENKKRFHHFSGIRLEGYKQIKQFCETSNNHALIHGVAMTMSTAAKELDFDINNLLPDESRELFEYIQQDSENLLNWAAVNLPVIFVDYYNNDYTSILYNDRFPLFLYQPVEDSVTLYSDLFFPDNKKLFDDNLWDKRERISLGIPYLFDKLEYYTFDKSQKHLYYTSDDIWNDLPTIVYEMANFLSLTIDEDRFLNWMHIYSEWRLNHDPFFARHLDRIVNAIVNNEYLSLQRFKLNLYKEALIQSKLIYDHNLNLKTWKLEKFPENTQELHKLLEPNIHQVDRTRFKQYTT